MFQSNVLKKLGQPVMTNLYYNTVKMLLERVSSVMIDHDSLLILVGYVEGAVKETDLSIAEECGMYWLLPSLKPCSRLWRQLCSQLHYLMEILN